jgi:hypothetical protein
MATAAKLRIVDRTPESRHLDQIESVVQGGGATPALEEVSSSWRRCTAELLINPDGRAAPHIVTDSELRVSREPVGKAIVYAQEEVDRLYAIVFMQSSARRGMSFCCAIPMELLFTTAVMKRRPNSSNTGASGSRSLVGKRQRHKWDRHLHC